MSGGIMLDVDRGELHINRAGLEVKAFLDADSARWPWSEIHHIAFEPGDGHGMFRRGLIGLASKPRARIFITTTAGDTVLNLRLDAGALRAVARRTVIEAPDSRGKLSVAGEPVAGFGPDA